MSSLARLIRQHPILAAFTAVYFSGLGMLALVRGNHEFLMYAAVMVVMIAGILWADRLARFSTFVLWGLSIWGLLHMAGGTLHVGATADGAPIVLYSLWLIPPDILKYDNVVHAYGFFIATLAAWEALRRYLDPKINRTLGLYVMVACIGMGLGSFNEVVEFLATVLLPETNVGGYVNTGLDLIANMIGATFACILIWRGRMEPRPTSGRTPASQNENSP